MENWSWDLERMSDLLGRTVDDVSGQPPIPLRSNDPSAVVLAGISDTKTFVNCEWLLDKFLQQYPFIPVKKKPFSHFEWPDFRKALTAPTGWPDHGDVIVYREALGHPLLYIGGLDCFRLYLKQLYQFACPLIPDSLIEAYIHDNRTEQQKADELRKKPVDAEEVWKISIISTNHLEIVPLYLLQAFGSQCILGGGRRLELIIHNTTASSGRSNCKWNEEVIDDYLEVNKWRFPLLKSASYQMDLSAALRARNLVVLLWAMRQEMYDAIEGRLYSLREGMDEELRKIFCREIFLDFGAIVAAFGQATEVEKSRIFLTSTRFKTPLSALATYLIQKIDKIVPENILVDCVAIDRSYRSVLAEELRVRTVDVQDTTVMGNIGGTMLMDPTAARILGHKGVIDAPESVKFSQPLLEVYWDARKLQVDFSVDAGRRANCMELLEGGRCSSILVSESAVELLQRWHGTFRKKTAWEASQPPISVGVVTTKDTGPAVTPGLVVAMPVHFSPDGSYAVVNQTSREEIRVILKKATAEITEILATMTKHFDASVIGIPKISEGAAEDNS